MLLHSPKHSCRILSLNKELLDKIWFLDEGEVVVVAEVVSISPDVGVLLEIEGLHAHHLFVSYLRWNKHS